MKVKEQAMGDLIRVEQQNEVVTITLNRPEKRNAINLAMLDELDQSISDISRIDGVRVLIVRGEGEVFSSGLDLAAFLELPQRYGQAWKKRMRTITHDLQSILNRFERLEIPTVALLQGYCLGLATELALACDIRIASEECKIGLPESRLGIIPDVGGTTRLTRLVGSARAKELIFTGRQIRAETAARWGMVNYVVPESELLTKAEELTMEICQAAPLAIGLAKRVIDGLTDLERGLMLESWAQSQLLDTDDFTEAVEAYMMKRPPKFKGQ
jgi:enoyl-CoA hydratase/carnithine racemase